MLEWIRDNDLPPGMEFISFSDRVAAVPAWHSVNRNPFNPDQEKEFEKLFKNICETHFSRNGHSGSAK